MHFELVFIERRIIRVSLFSSVNRSESVKFGHSCLVELALQDLACLRKASQTDFRGRYLQNLPHEVVKIRWQFVHVCFRRLTVELSRAWRQGA